MHLGKQVFDLFAQFFRKSNTNPAPGLAVVQRPLRDVAAQHGFQAHSLTAELQRVPGILPGAAALILHRIGLPQSLFPDKGNTGIPPVILQNITLPGYPQLCGVDAHPAGDEPVPPAFLEAWVMGVLVGNSSVDGAEILRPLIFDVNEGPLPAAESKMLQAR